MVSQKIFKNIKTGPPTSIDFNFYNRLWLLTKSKVQLMSSEIIHLASQKKTADHVSATKEHRQYKGFSEAKLSIGQNIYEINKFIKPSREFFVDLRNNKYY